MLKAARPIPLRVLLGLTAAVALAHLLVLENAPLSLGASDSMGTRVFSTRRLRIDAAPAQTGDTTVRSALAPVRSGVRPVTAVAAAPAGLPVAEPVAQPAAAEPLPAPTEPIAQAGVPEPAVSSAQSNAPESAAPPAPAPAPLSKDAALVARTYSVPGSIRLKFNATGQRAKMDYRALGELLWLQDGKAYEARMELNAWPILSRVLTSAGRMTADGLAPTRFSDRFRSELAAHLDRDKERVTFSANTPDAPLLPGAQDQLSAFVQLASMIGGEPLKYPPGTSIAFQTVGPRVAEPWVFVVDTEEDLSLPGGHQMALKLVRSPRREFDQKIEIWLAPALSYLPARIRITQANGDFIDQQWRSTSTP